MSSIYISLNNGLCNRLIPYASALRLARMSNRALIVHWNCQPTRSCIAYEGEKCSFEDILQLPDDVKVTNENTSEKFSFSREYKFPFYLDIPFKVDISGRENIKIDLPLTPIYLENEECNFIKVVNSQGKITLDNTTKSIGNFLKATKFESILERGIEKTVQKFSKNMIGIHIRSTDGGFANYDWKEIVKVLIQKAKIWTEKNPQNKIFLATDSEEIHNTFQRELQQKVITFSPPRTKFKNDRHNVMCGVIDFGALANANCKIIGTTGSTFSMAAFMLAKDEIEKYLVKEVADIPEF